MPRFRIRPLTFDAATLPTPIDLPGIGVLEFQALSGPFVVGDRVASPRAPDMPMTVVQVGPVDFGGETGYLCEVQPTDQRWFSEPDLVSAP